MKGSEPNTHTQS